jgi:hypothetical protein
MAESPLYLGVGPFISPAEYAFSMGKETFSFLGYGTCMSIQTATVALYK